MEVNKEVKIKKRKKVSNGKIRNTTTTDKKERRGKKKKEKEIRGGRKGDPRHPT